MKKFYIQLTILILAFFLGYGFKSITNEKVNQNQSVKKVTGLGGIFFKCADPKKMRAWYASNLGLNTNDYGAIFEWRQGSDTTKKGFTQWSPFNEKTKYFAPSTKEFMINYRVEHLEQLLGELKTAGVTIVDSIETVPYGKFLHIMDIENNKIELWEPNDIEYEKMGLKMGAKTTM